MESREKTSIRYPV